MDVHGADLSITDWRRIIDETGRGPSQGPVAHVDRLRNRTHRDRIRRVRAGTARRAHEAFRKVDELGLVEKG